MKGALVFISIEKIRNEIKFTEILAEQINTHL